MSTPNAFYQKEKLKFEQKGDHLRQKSKTLSLLRLSVFLIIIPAAYFTYENKVVFSSLLALGFIGFIILVIVDQNLQIKRKLTEFLIEINKTEIDALHGAYQQLPKGSKYNDPNHYYSNDIDLFGKGSFFQYLNRTATISGKDKLAEILTENKITNIRDKQKVIEELSQRVVWRQHFLALSKMVVTETDDKVILSWIKNHKSVLPAYMTHLPLAFSLSSGLMILLVSMGVIHFYFLATWFFIGLFITLPFIKRLNHLYQDAGKIKNTFKQYHPLLKEIEDLKVKAFLALEQQNKIKTRDKKASVILKEFSKILDAFDQRNNMLFGVLGNGLLLWDIRQSLRIDHWVKTYHHQVENWFETISYFDAQISLSNYAYNHPEHHFPEISQNNTLIAAEEIAHPLLDIKTRVPNNILISDADFHIITGANMAGKSTFLRTVALAMVMANSGLPVCAKKLVYNPIKLITSMRTSDSLMEESSYFYAEIMRLRFIVNQMKTEKYFIVLDEILKGTNSKDKAMGSVKFVEKLVRSGSAGIIATHDLSLCEIEKGYPQIHNKFFDAKIKDEELDFDYKLKDGICTNMNASFLMKKMEII